jgi:hypothetical protein
MEAINQVVEAITSAGYHAQMAATFSAAAVEAAKKAAVLAQLAEEHSRLAAEKAKLPNAAEAAEPAQPVEPAQPAEPARPVKPVEPAPKRQRRELRELPAEEVELLRLADEQAAEQEDEQANGPHDADAWDRYLEAGIDSHFQVEASPSPLPLDSPFDSDW